jgi:hypothetical protein
VPTKPLKRTLQGLRTFWRSRGLARNAGARVVPLAEGGAEVHTNTLPDVVSDFAEFEIFGVNREIRPLTFRDSRGRFQFNHI